MNRYSKVVRIYRSALLGASYGWNSTGSAIVGALTPAAGPVTVDGFAPCVYGRHGTYEVEAWAIGRTR
jgi:hypothetical protein